MNCYVGWASYSLLKDSWPSYFCIPNSDNSTFDLIFVDRLNMVLVGGVPAILPCMTICRFIMIAFQVSQLGFFISLSRVASILILYVPRMD